MALPESKQAVGMDADSDEETSSDETPSNENSPVKRVVNEIVALMSDIHDSKQELRARGVPFHTINVMVEMGIHGKEEEQAKLRETALVTSRDQHGAAAITEESLDEHLVNLVALEKDLGLARRLGRNQGLEMASVNSLTHIIRENPGDGGEKVVNTFLAYAIACDIPLDKVAELAKEASAGPTSVLPDIPREEAAISEAQDRRRLYVDVFIGCVMAFFALAWLT